MMTRNMKSLFAAAVIFVGMSGLIGPNSTKPEAAQTGPSLVSAQILNSRDWVSKRAMWVWKTTSLLHPPDSGVFMDFVKAKTISTVFFSVPINSFPNAVQDYRVFLRLAHVRGLAVEALNGEPDWILPERRSKAVLFLNLIFHYNRESAPDERFDAIHLDVEPHTLPDWKGGKRNELAREYVEFMEQIHEMTKREKMPLVVDIPDSFGRIELGSTTLASAVIDSTDEVAVMAYRNRPEKIIEAVRPCVESADAGRKRVWIGIDPLYLHGPESETPSRTDFDGAASKIEETFRDHESFLGVAFHDYLRYRELASNAQWR
jgi:hypothetical protein